MRATLLHWVAAWRLGAARLTAAVGCVLQTARANRGSTGTALHCAGLIQAGTLVIGQRPTHRTEVFAQLHLVACANQHCAHGRPLQQPVDGDLRHAAAGLCGNGIERIDDVEQARIVDRRAGRGGGMQTAVLRQRLAAPQLAGQPPPTSGLHTTAPMPWSIPSGISSHS